MRFRLYIVMCNVGEYSDSYTYPVAAYVSDKLAAQRVIDCEMAATAYAERYKKRSGNPFHSDDQMRSAYDPKLPEGETSPNYFIEETELVDAEGVIGQ